MNNSSGNGRLLNTLIGVSLMLNITYMGIKFYKMYQEGKKKAKCGCKKNQG